MNWFACELHCHTLHSDGNFSPSELVTSAIEHQLDGIAITDHNTISPVLEVCAEGQKQGLVILKGVEWTTFFGHMLVQHPNHCLDWYDANLENIDEKIKNIKEQGGLTGVAHPFRAGNPLGTGCHWEYQVKNWDNMCYYEILSGENPTLSYFNKRAIHEWTKLLDKGYQLTATSGIDWHRALKKDIFYACTYLGTKDRVLSENAMYDGLKYHKTSISIGMRLDFSLESHGTIYNIGDTIPPCEASVNLEVDMETRRDIWSNYDIKWEKLVIISNEQKVVFEGDLTSELPSLSVKSSSWYVAQLFGTVGGKESLIAITSPIFCD